MICCRKVNYILYVYYDKRETFIIFFRKLRTLFYSDSNTSFKERKITYYSKENRSRDFHDQLKISIVTITTLFHNSSNLPNIICHNLIKK